MVKRRTLPLALLAALVAGVLSIPFFAQPLRPWPDQGFMLQAAVRHARGEGLTLPVPDATDVTASQARRLTYFPPLYPLAVSAALRAGGAVQPPGSGDRLGRAVARSVKLTNAAALVFGVLGWCLLAAHVLGSRSLGTLFAGLLAVAGGATVPKGGTVDYLTWAAMPWWLGALLLADAAADARRFGRACAWALAAGVLGALLVGVRWAAVFLIPSALLFWLARALQWSAAPAAAGEARPAGVIARLLAPAGRRALGARLLLAAAAAGPVAGSYLLLTAINRSVTDGGSLLAYIEPRWDFHRLATLYPFESIFSVPLALEPLLTRAWRALDPARASPALSLLFRLALPAAALMALRGAVRRAARRAPRVPPSPEHAATAVLARRARTLGVATLGALLGFLAWMSLRYTWSFVDWTYLDEARYYRPVWPLAALVWLSLVDRLPTASRFRTAAVALLLLGVLYLLQGRGRLALSRLGAHDESWELVARVRALEGRPGLHVVLDNDVSDYVIAAGPKLVARLYPDPEQGPRLVAGRPAELWLVRRLREPTPYVRDHEWDRKRFETVRARFGARRAWVSSGGGYELWHARVGDTGVTR
jgi:hypothetical protein